LSGEGKFNNPYLLDYKSDPIIKSVGKLLSNEKLWKKFIQNLNSKLWNLQINSFTWDLKLQLFDILEYIDKINRKIFKQSEFKVSLWVVGITYDYINTYLNDWRESEISEKEALKNFLLNTEADECYYKLDLGYIKKKPIYFNVFLDYWKKMTHFNKMKEFKLALVLQKTE